MTEKTLTKDSNEHYPGKINNNDLICDQKDFLNSNLGIIDYVIRIDKRDFLKLVSKKIWEFLHLIYKGGPEIKRIAFTQKDENNENRTYFDLHYKVFNLYFAVKYDEEVDIKSIISKEPFKLFIPKYKTIFDFKDLIMNCFLNLYEINLKLVKIYKRLWKVGVKNNLKDLKKYIFEKKGLIEKSMSTEFPGELLDSKLIFLY